MSGHNLIPMAGFVVPVPNDYAKDWYDHATGFRKLVFQVNEPPRLIKRCNPSSKQLEYPPPAIATDPSIEDAQQAQWMEAANGAFWDICSAWPELMQWHFWPWHVRACALLPSRRPFQLLEILKFLLGNNIPRGLIRLFLEVLDAFTADGYGHKDDTDKLFRMYDDYKNGTYAPTASNYFYYDVAAAKKRPLFVGPNRIPVPTDPYPCEGVPQLDKDLAWYGNAFWNNGLGAQAANPAMPGPANNPNPMPDLGGEDIGDASTVMDVDMESIGDDSTLEPAQLAIIHDMIGDIEDDSTVSDLSVNDDDESVAADAVIADLGLTPAEIAAGDGLPDALLPDDVPLGNVVAAVAEEVVQSGVAALAEADDDDVGPIGPRRKAAKRALESESESDSESDGSVDINEHSATFSSRVRLRQQLGYYPFSAEQKKDDLDVAYVWRDMREEICRRLEGWKPATAASTLAAAVGAAPRSYYDIRNTLTSVDVGTVFLSRIQGGDRAVPIEFLTAEELAKWRKGGDMLMGSAVPTAIKDVRVPNWDTMEYSPMALSKRRLPSYDTEGKELTVEERKAIADKEGKMPGVREAQLMVRDWVKSYGEVKELMGHCATLAIFFTKHYKSPLNYIIAQIYKFRGGGDPVFMGRGYMHSYEREGPILNGKPSVLVDKWIYPDWQQKQRERYERDNAPPVPEEVFIPEPLIVDNPRSISTLKVNRLKRMLDAQRPAQESAQPCTNGCKNPAHPCTDCTMRERGLNSGKRVRPPTSDIEESSSDDDEHVAVYRRPNPLLLDREYALAAREEMHAANNELVPYEPPPNNEVVPYEPIPAPEAVFDNSEVPKKRRVIKAPAPRVTRSSGVQTRDRALAKERRAAKHREWRNFD